MDKPNFHIRYEVQIDLLAITYQAMSWKSGSSSNTSVVVIWSVVKLLGLGQEVTAREYYQSEHNFLQLAHRPHMSATPPLQNCYPAGRPVWGCIARSQIQIYCRWFRHRRHTSLFLCVLADISCSTSASVCACPQALGDQHSETLQIYRNHFLRNLWCFRITFASIWKFVYGPFLVCIALYLRCFVERPILSLEILTKFIALIAAVSGI